MQNDTAKLCRGCGAPFEPWSRAVHPGSAGSHCRDCYNRKCRDRQTGPRLCEVCGGERGKGRRYCDRCAPEAIARNRAERDKLRDRSGRVKRPPPVYYGPSGLLTRDQVVDRLRRRDGPNCALCGRPFNSEARRRRDQLSIDHILPVKLGGTDHITNLQLAHMGCNSRKGFGESPEELMQRYAGVAERMQELIDMSAEQFDRAAQLHDLLE